MKKISVNLSPEILKRLKEEREYDKYLSKSVTTIIHEALAMYFLRKDLERGMPITELSVKQYPLTLDECSPEPIQKGLIMPDMSKTRVRPDPDIKNSFHLSHDIRPGDGVTGRLKAIGVDPLSIIKARRNRQRGREYDKSLEQYFDLL